MTTLAPAGPPGALDAAEAAFRLLCAGPRPLALHATKLAVGLPGTGRCPSKGANGVRGAAGHRLCWRRLGCYGRGGRCGAVLPSSGGRGGGLSAFDSLEQHAQVGRYLRADCLLLAAVAALCYECRQGSQGFGCVDG
jgi:hypothetical protein